MRSSVTVPPWVATSAVAQSDGLRFIARADVGGVLFGRFVEQRVGGGEREVRADPAVLVGASGGIDAAAASVESGVHVAPTDFRLRGDSGAGLAVGRGGSAGLVAVVTTPLGDPS